jgi:hypothetical protein
LFERALELRSIEEPIGPGIWQMTEEALAELLIVNQE